MRILLSVVLSVMSLNFLACDICNMSISLTPDDTKSALSIIYRHRFASRTFEQLVYTPVQNESESRHSGVVLLPGMEKQEYQEIYSVVELRGIYNLNNRISFFGSLPLIRNQRIINGENQFTINNVGDPIVMARYAAIRKETENKLNHRLILGAGVKMPLGSYDYQKGGEVVSHDIQAGTGSWDFVFSFEYLLKYKNLGIISNTNYKANTLNTEVNYMFGNTFNSTINMFYLKKMKNKITIMPYIGGYVEIAGMDIEHKYFEENTGGELVFGTIGFQFFIDKIQVEAMYQHTLNNKLNGDLQLNTKRRFQLGISYLFH